MTHPSPHNAVALLSALRDARTDAEMVDHMKNRVRSRLSVSLLVLSPALVSGRPGASLASHATALRPGGAMRSVTSHKASIAAALAPVFALGVLTGAAADHWVERRSPTRAPAIAISVPLVTPPLAPLRTAQEPVLTPEELARVPSDEPSPSAAWPPAPSNSASTLGAEQSLLDAARHALARGEPGAGLAPLNRHALRFPKGILAEEREALAVRILCAVGHAGAATARAENFHRRFPNSLFAPAVNNAIATISQRNGGPESKP